MGEKASGKLPHLTAEAFKSEKEFLEQNVANDKTATLVTAVKQLLCGPGELGEMKGKTFFNFVCTLHAQAKAERKLEKGNKSPRSEGCGAARSSAPPVPATAGALRARVEPAGPGCFVRLQLWRRLTACCCVNERGVKFKNASEAVPFFGTCFSEITRFFAWGSCGGRLPRYPRRKSELFAKNRWRTSHPLRTKSPAKNLFASAATVATRPVHTR
eukprot:COSAG06_NODE_1393_length_9596_cov_47.877014_10_plen_215_part_00